MSELLRALNISFAYRDRAALRDVALTLSTAELVAIIGPNGSGKSTLIRTLLGQLRAGGSIEWEGRSIRKWNRRVFAQRVAYLPQSPTADLDQTVEECLRVGRAPYWKTFGIESENDAKIVTDVASSLGLTDLLARPMVELSGGQRQRIFVARCLVQRPAAMLLDEPNTYLDLKHQVELLRLLKQLARERNIGVLMASHDVNLAAAFADRMILLDAGQIAATGTPREVMQPDLLSRVYSVPLRIVESEDEQIILPIT